MVRTILLFLLLIPFSSWCQSDIEKADSLIAKAVPLNEHGLSVLVAKGEKIIYKKTAGYADVEDKKQVDERTIFRIGSVTKQFTAAAILKLEELDKLSVSDPLTKYIPDFPDGDKVTIHHLLTHTSGINSYTDQPDFLERVEKPVEMPALVEKIKTLGYGFEPGDEWKYNNSAYLILGYIIEKTADMSYEKFLKKNLFKPAGMKNTGVYDNTKTYKNEALG